MPPRHVLPDLALVGIAMNPPSTPAELAKVRGVDDRHARGKVGAAILEAVKEGLELPSEAQPSARRDDVDRDHRPGVALAAAWLAQLARELKIDTTLLATRSDLSAFLSDGGSSRLGNGWRKHLLGEPLRRLLDGEFALAFDGNGGLSLEERSGKPVVVALPVPDVSWAG
jgi:ribonuclease D